MKRILGMLVVAVFIASAAYAAIGVRNQNSNVGQATDLNCSTGLTCTMNGSGVDVTVAGGAVTSTSITVGTPTIGGVLGTNFIAVANGIEVDGDIYVDGSIYDSKITEGAALCLTTGGAGVGGYMGHCSTTPTNGNCTCVKN